jgi:hypothetical protein
MHSVIYCYIEILIVAYHAKLKLMKVLYYNLRPYKTFVMTDISNISFTTYKLSQLKF